MVTEDVMSDVHRKWLADTEPKLQEFKNEAIKPVAILVPATCLDIPSIIYGVPVSHVRGFQKALLIGLKDNQPAVRVIRDFSKQGNSTEEKL